MAQKRKQGMDSHELARHVYTAEGERSRKRFLDLLSRGLPLQRPAPSQWKQLEGVLDANDHGHARLRARGTSSLTFFRSRARPRAPARAQERDRPPIRQGAPRRRRAPRRSTGQNESCPPF